MPKPDYDFNDCGSIVMVRPLNDAARDHLAEHLGEEAQWLGGALAVEPRYAPDLSAELCREGFAVELPCGRVVTDADLVEG